MPTTTNAISTGGTTVRFSTFHPNVACTAPEVSAVIATLPKTMKSWVDCTLTRSAAE